MLPRLRCNWTKWKHETASTVFKTGTASPQTTMKISSWAVPSYLPIPGTGICNWSAWSAACLQSNNFPLITLISHHLTVICWWQISRDSSASSELSCVVSYTLTGNKATPGPCWAKWPWYAIINKWYLFQMIKTSSKTRAYFTMQNKDLWKACASKGISRSDVSQTGLYPFPAAQPKMTVLRALPNSQSCTNIPAASQLQVGTTSGFLSSPARSWCS